jgi:hypothetical protein
MAVRCIFVDIDGFAGRDATGANLLIPREVAIVRAHISAGACEIVEIASMYFDGGLDAEFANVNRATIRYQVRNIHGYPADEGQMAALIPPDGELHSLGTYEAHAAAAWAAFLVTTRTRDMAEAWPGDEPLVFVHKGGDEGRLLRRAAASVPAPDRVAVVDLNDLGCPRAALLNTPPPCSEALHAGLRGAARNAGHHCPRAECVAQARWVADTCTGFDDGTVRRASSLPVDAARAVVVADACPAPAQWGGGARRDRAAANYVRAALARAGEYAADNDVRAVVAQLREREA